MPKKPKAKPAPRPRRGERPKGLLGIATAKAGPVASATGDTPADRENRAGEIVAWVNAGRAQFVATLKAEAEGAEVWLTAKGYDAAKRSVLRYNLPPPQDHRRAAETLAFLDAAKAVLPRLENATPQEIDLVRDVFELGRAAAAVFAMAAGSPSLRDPGESLAHDLDALNDELAKRDKLPPNDAMLAVFNAHRRSVGRPEVGLTKPERSRFAKALSDARDRPRNTTLRRIRDE